MNNRIPLPKKEFSMCSNGSCSSIDAQNAAGTCTLNCFPLSYLNSQLSEINDREINVEWLLCIAFSLHYAL